MTPVFIIGGSRTGSELIRRILRKYTDIDMIPEMFLRYPWWQHTDFISNAKKCLSPGKDTYDADQLMDLVFSKTLYGYFWTTIDEFDRNEMTRRYSSTDMTLKSFFTVLLEMSAEKNNKSIHGAKFPVHYSHAEVLLEWFPECKIIHTTRDPRAIYVSQSNKYTSSSYSFFKNSWVRFKHFTHIVIQTIWTAKIHSRIKEKDNYYLFRYEDLLENPELNLTKLCGYLDIEFNPEMANPELDRNSSFDETKGKAKGFQKSMAYTWMKRINPITSRVIKMLCGKSMSGFGYS